MLRPTSGISDMRCGSMAMRSSDTLVSIIDACDCTVTWSETVPSTIEISLRAELICGQDNALLDVFAETGRFHFEMIAADRQLEKDVAAQFGGDCSASQPCVVIDRGHRRAGYRSAARVENDP